jgi:hypothetical protein
MIPRTACGISNARVYYINYVVGHRGLPEFFKPQPLRWQAINPHTSIKAITYAENHT